MTPAPTAPSALRQRSPTKSLLMASGPLTLMAFSAWAYPLKTAALVIASVLMFLACLWAARRLYGRRAAWVFAGLALPMGWFAEQMGSSRGWFFGRYDYTDVLGPQIGDVPLVIPLMWFALCVMGYTLACLLLWREPALPRPGGIRGGLTAWLAAMVITAFDLGADPYFVFVLKAWIMAKTDGGWFGETLQGFVGWMVVAFAIVAAFQRWGAPERPARIDARTRRAALVPMALYAAAMIFQMVFGHPVEIRAIAFFAMGIPLMVTAVAWWHWQADHTEASL